MATIHYLTQIEFDFGAVRMLPSECQRIGISNPLIVTDAGVRAVGLVDRAIAALGDLRYTVFDQTPSNPTESAVRAASEMYRQYRCDGLIAVGGGSSMDLAKGVAILATHDEPLTCYATVEGGSAKISNRVAPMIAVPTTAGTGSEAARGAIIIVDDGRKLGFHSWNLMPKSAILDPELTLGLPPLLTAATGMDAITHCIEAYMSSSVNPPADALALDGLGRGWPNILRAVQDGTDREARWQMMCTSMEAALAFQKGLGCVHSLSHAAAGVNPRLHHGTLNAVLLPAVIRFNAPVDSIQRENRLQRIAQTIGLPGCDRHGTELAEAIRESNVKIGLPAGLSEMGVSRNDFDKIILSAMVDHSHFTNPRLATAEDYREMLEASLI